jgi:hypothetical protein
MSYRHLKPVEHVAYSPTLAATATGLRVERIRMRRVNDDGPSELQTKLNDRGIPTTKGGSWPATCSREGAHSARMTRAEKSFPEPEPSLADDVSFSTGRHPQPPSPPRGALFRSPVRGAFAFGHGVHWS